MVYNKLWKMHDINGVDFLYTPEKNNIGVKLSGGIDSATILYTLGWMRKEGIMHPETNIVPFCGVNYTRPYQKIFGDKIVETVNKLLDINIPLPIAEYAKDANDLENTITTLQRKLKSEGTINFWYMGESKFLPNGYVNETKWKDESTPAIVDKKYKYAVLLDVNHPLNFRYNHDQDMKGRTWESPPKGDKTGSSVLPWRNMNKLHVKKVLEHFGVTNELLDVTRSCEYFIDPVTPMLDFEEHCGECYWCVERLITFDRL